VRKLLKRVLYPITPQQTMHAHLVKIIVPVAFAAQ